MCAGFKGQFIQERREVDLNISKNFIGKNVTSKVNLLEAEKGW